MKSNEKALFLVEGWSTEGDGRTSTLVLCSRNARPERASLDGRS